MALGPIVDGGITPRVDWTLGTWDLNLTPYENFEALIAKYWADETKMKNTLKNILTPEMLAQHFKYDVSYGGYNYQTIGYVDIEAVAPVTAAEYYSKYLLTVPYLLDTIIPTAEDSNIGVYGMYSNIHSGMILIDSRLRTYSITKSVPSSLTAPLTYGIPKSYTSSLDDTIEKLVEDPTESYYFNSRYREDAGGITYTFVDYNVDIAHVDAIIEASFVDHPSYTLVSINRRAYSVYISMWSDNDVIIHTYVRFGDAIIAVDAQVIDISTGEEIRYQNFVEVDPFVQTTLVDNNVSTSMMGIIDTLPTTSQTLTDYGTYTNSYGYLTNIGLVKTTLSKFNLGMKEIGTHITRDGYTKSLDRLATGPLSTKGEHEFLEYLVTFGLAETIASIDESTAVYDLYYYKSMTELSADDNEFIVNLHNNKNLKTEAHNRILAFTLDTEIDGSENYALLINYTALMLYLEDGTNPAGYTSQEIFRLFSLSVYLNANNNPSTFWEGVWNTLLALVLGTEEGPGVLSIALAMSNPAAWLVAQGVGWGIDQTNWTDREKADAKSAVSIAALIYGGFDKGITDPSTLLGAGNLAVTEYAKNEAKKMQDKHTKYSNSITAIEDEAEELEKELEEYEKGYDVLIGKEYKSPYAEYAESYGREYTKDYNNEYKY